MFGISDLSHAWNFRTVATAADSLTCVELFACLLFSYGSHRVRKMKKKKLNEIFWIYSTSPHELGDAPIHFEGTVCNCMNLKKKTLCVLEEISSWLMSFFVPIFSKVTSFFLVFLFDLQLWCFSSAPFFFLTFFFLLFLLDWSVLYQRQGQQQDAVQAIVCALQLDPALRPAWIHLGLLYEAQQQLEWVQLQYCKSRSFRTRLIFVNFVNCVKLRKLVFTKCFFMHILIDGWPNLLKLVFTNEEKSRYCKGRNFRRRKISYFSVQNLSYGI